MLSFAQTIPELERFIGEEVEAVSTWREASALLPPDQPIRVTLTDIRDKTETVAAGVTAAERATRRDRVRFAELIGTAGAWLIPEKDFEGAIWLEPDRQLKVLAANGAFILTADEPLATPPYSYDLDRIRPDGQHLPVTAYVSKTRPLVVGARLSTSDGAWLVERVDKTTDPPLVVCRRPGFP